MGEFGLPGLLRRGRGLHRRMAGAGRAAAFPARSRSEARNSRRGASCVGNGMHAGRRILALLAALLFLGAAQAQVVSTRIWPARDYTRLTIESKSPIEYTIFALKDPERLVLDLELDEMPPALAELGAKVADDDPYIQGLRVARHRPGIVRLVLDLKTEAKPQSFSLKPIGEYGNRLVLDIYPAVAIDPLAALIEQSNKAAAQRPEINKETAKITRLATVVV